MLNFHWPILVFTLISGALAKSCDIDVFANCQCGYKQYLEKDKPQYVLNCTNTGFTNVTILKLLPHQIQVLIFVGNEITELPWNVFGSYNFTQLKIIDLSNNKIKLIHGKSFHHVSQVSRLILNHNEILISDTNNSDNRHPRLFSNFENLQELHLTDAFQSGSELDLGDLHDIFNNSNLKKLVKLHLEQNRIVEFKDPSVFCDLTNLMDLHLSDNRIQKLNANLTCLRRLRYIGLEGNCLSSLKSSELESLDRFTERNQSITINIEENPFSCECEIRQLYDWLQNTKVIVKNKNKLRCKHVVGGGITTGPYVMDVPKNHCSNQELLKSAPIIENHTGLSAFLAVALCLSLALNIYSHRGFLTTFVGPALSSLTQKVQYTNIGKNDVHEMEV